MKIVSYNINGIRASAKLGLVDWIKDFDADVYCFQEVRASEKVARELLTDGNKQLDLFSNIDEDDRLNKYNMIFNCGNVAGYAGTMILSKLKPDKVIYGMGEYWSDDEGRTTTIVVGSIAIVNTYIPNGNSRLDFKMEYIDALNKFLTKLKKEYSVICVGDYNIAHNEIDLTNPKECKNKSVFLQTERDAFNELLNIGMFDSFRYLNPDVVKYSWRSYRSRYDASYNSWKYRIDYILATNDLKDKFINCDILDLVYSDHLPVVAEFTIDGYKHD